MQQLKSECVNRCMSLFVACTRSQTLCVCYIRFFCSKKKKYLYLSQCQWIHEHIMSTIKYSYAIDRETEANIEWRARVCDVCACRVAAMQMRLRLRCHYKLPHMLSLIVQYIIAIIIFRSIPIGIFLHENVVRWWAWVWLICEGMGARVCVCVCNRLFNNAKGNNFQPNSGSADWWNVLDSPHIEKLCANRDINQIAIITSLSFFIATQSNHIAVTAQKCVGGSRKRDPTVRIHYRFVEISDVARQTPAGIKYKQPTKEVHSA